ncbi:hypothetical protein D3C81_1760590 [compost metagenome]
MNYLLKDLLPRLEAGIQRADGNGKPVHCGVQPAPAADGYPLSDSPSGQAERADGQTAKSIVADVGYGSGEAGELDLPGRRRLLGVRQ